MLSRKVLLRVAVLPPRLGMHTTVVEQVEVLGETITEDISITLEVMKERERRGDMMEKEVREEEEENNNHKEEVDSGREGLEVLATTMKETDMRRSSMEIIEVRTAEEETMGV